MDQVEVEEDLEAADQVEDLEEVALEVVEEMEAVVVLGAVLAAAVVVASEEAAVAELAVATVLPSVGLAVELWRSTASLHTVANTSVKFPSDSFRLSLPRPCIHPQQGSTLTLTVAANTTNCNQSCILHTMELSDEIYLMS